MCGAGAAREGRLMGLTGNWDGRISRRTLLRAGGSATAAYVLLGRAATSASAAPPFEGEPFALGVASGDPTPDGVVLWTRLAPDPLASGGMPEQVFGVRYEVAKDPEFRQIVRRGAIEALPEEAHTVHAEIGGLQPDTPYWYRFKWGTSESRSGRTRTAPPTGSTAPMRFGFVSCQNYTNGFFGAYADLAAQDVDLVVHLGDYIYEGPGLGALRVRDHAPQAELFTLNDYRLRHAQYRTDPDLQKAHATHPFLMTWDDHEFKDNYADLDLEPDQPLETVAERRAAAYLAYWEHAPLPRSRKPVGKDMPLYRRLHWGALATFHVLDTRQYRSNQIEAQCLPADRDPVSSYCPGVLDPSRGILGAAQRDWLFEGLVAPGAAWNVIANQVGFAPLDRDSMANSKQFSLDNWDGYVADRQQVLDVLARQGRSNTVVITGDAHENSVRNVPPDFKGFDGVPVATEFMGTSMTSEGDVRPFRTRHGGTAENPHRVFNDNHRGYVRVTLDPQLWSGEFRTVESVVTRTPIATPLATYVVHNGVPGAERASI
jgi:alkaline phosphatase D